jgi:hypothetical protein
MIRLEMNTAASSDGGQFSAMTDVARQCQLIKVDQTDKGTPTKRTV